MSETKPTQSNTPDGKLSDAEIELQRQIAENAALAAAAEAEAAKNSDVPALGSKVLLKAVYAFLVNPDTNVTVEVGEPKLVIFDWWWEIQFKAGKLKLADL